MVACAAGLAYAALPSLFAHRIRAELAERGFPDARLDVKSVGWGHLSLRDVHLAEGLDLGALELDRGVSLLWSSPDEVSIDGARVSSKALARTAPAVKRTSGGGSAMFRRLTVKSSIVDVEGRPARVAGKASANGKSLDVSITVRDPSPRGWSAEGRGRIVLDERIALEQGKIALDVPRHAAHGATVDRAKVEAEVSGDLTSLKLRGSGVARFGRIGVKDVDVAGVTLPFSFDRAGVHVGKARGTTAGGELTLDPFVLSGETVKLTLRAKGLRLRELLGTTGHASGTGLIDGFVSLRLGDGGLELERGELRARRPGRIQVARGSAAEPSPFELQKTVVDALSDFQYDRLVAELAPRGAGTELTVSTRGRGRKNRQELDIAVRINGVRDVVKRLTGASQ